MINLRYRADSAADAATVWAVLADHARMKEWLSRVWRSRLVQAGSDGLNGVGAIRGLWSLGGPMQEEVVTFEPPNRLEYRMVRGNPLGKDLHGRCRAKPQCTCATSIQGKSISSGAEEVMRQGRAEQINHRGHAAGT